MWEAKSQSQSLQIFSGTFPATQERQSLENVRGQFYGHFPELMSENGLWHVKCPWLIERSAVLLTKWFTICLICLTVTFNRTNHVKCSSYDSDDHETEQKLNTLNNETASKAFIWKDFPDNKKGHLQKHWFNNPHVFLITLPHHGIINKCLFELPNWICVSFVAQ